MNYSKIYNDLISRGVERKTINGYFEMHHIKPKCFGGSDRAHNMVALTAREHFLAHLLLTKIYPESVEMKLAVLFFKKSPRLAGQEIKNSHAYETVRANFVKQKKELAIRDGCKSISYYIKIPRELNGMTIRGEWARLKKKRAICVRFLIANLIAVGSLSYSRNPNINIKIGGARHDFNTRAIMKAVDVLCEMGYAINEVCSSDVPVNKRKLSCLRATNKLWDDFSEVREKCIDSYNESMIQY